MKKRLIPVLFSVVVGGCSLLEPVDGEQEISTPPETLGKDKTVLEEETHISSGTIVLPAEDVAVETSEISPPDIEMAELTELEPESATPAEQIDLSLPGEVAAGTDTEATDIPVEDISPSQMSPGLPADAVRVEILNASGIPGLEQQVSERLAGNDYVISWSEDGAVSDAQSETRIKYRPDFAREAVRLGHILPGNQIVTRGDELPEAVDIRIIVGSDQQ